MTLPTISVIVPVRNGERTIERCLASILATRITRSRRARSSSSTTRRPIGQRSSSGAAIEWGDFDELATWSATLPDGARHILRETGFTSASPRGPLHMAAQPSLLIRDLADTPNGQRLLDLDRWDVRMLYSDGD